MTNSDNNLVHEITTVNLIKVLGISPDKADYLISTLSLQNVFFMLNPYGIKYLFVDCIEDRELKESLISHLLEEGFNVKRSALSDCFRIDSLS